MTKATTQLICGDNQKTTSTWKPNYVNAIVTDPPYELGFMGKGWDSSGIAYNVKMWKQMLRITKPGGFLLCFGGTRTYHRITCAIEDAGWQIRDCMMWLYGSGFPKSHDISKAIQKAKGVKPDKIEPASGVGFMKPDSEDWHVTKNKLTMPKPEGLAQLWNGYGTALKPAWEPIIVAMKSIDGTFANNAEKYGVAGLNIDGGRIGINNNDDIYAKNPHTIGTIGENDIYGKGKPTLYKVPQGRWPANLILDEEAGKMLDEQSGISKSTNNIRKNKNPTGNGLTHGKMKPIDSFGFNDSGGASRFFYCAKTSRKERNMGMEDCEDKLLARSGGARSAEKQGKDEYLQDHIGLNRVAVVKNNHPTVKPLALMKYLCTLLKMPSTDQIILDPFMGSGTTGMVCAELGISFIGIDKEPEYCEISAKRIGSILGKTLPISRNVEMFRTAKDFAGGSRRPNENLPRISDHRQRIINTASAKLRAKRGT